MKSGVMLKPRPSPAELLGQLAGLLDPPRVSRVGADAPLLPSP